MFSHVQNTQTSKVDSPCFFSNVFFSTKYAPFLLKIGEDFNIDIRRAKGFKLMEK
jgi:hypothetical protein